MREECRERDEERAQVAISAAFDGVKPSCLRTQLAGPHASTVSIGREMVG
jgi:hypothetical protein